MTAFYFKTKLDQTLLLGITAATAEQLLEGMRRVPESCIYYHTHKFLHQHHYLSPEPPNDFAYWITEVLNDSKLGEKLSSVDLVQFRDLESLRNTFVAILEAHLANADRAARAPEGEEFHFMASRLFVLATPHHARSLGEFAEALRHVTVNSVYYHVFDARLRLERGENDFSRWFRDLGEQGLAEEVGGLDPYTHTLEGLRNKVIRLVQKHDPD